MNLNARNFAGLTPLMDAAGHGKTSSVWLLLANGADLSLKDPAGRTALDFARENNWNEVAAMIEKRQNTPHAPKLAPPAWHDEAVNGHAFESQAQVARFANEHGFLVVGTFKRSQWPATVVSIQEANDSISFQLKDGVRHDYRNYQGYALKLLRLEDVNGGETAVLMRSRDSRF